MAARPGVDLAAALVAAATAPLGCRDAQPEPSPPAPPVAAPQGRVLQAAENEDAAASGPTRHASAVARHERVAIPAGTFLAGSTPGDRGRDPTLEPALLQVSLGAFEIDRLPFPGEPGAPPLVNVTRAHAAELCERRGGRLCTELEWERACKGPDGSVYAASATWDPACAREPTSCASGFGVLGLGGALREWTSSDVVPADRTVAPGAAVRGAPAEASGVDHRCARRSSVDPEAIAGDLGFRCCHGPRNAANLPAPAFQQTYQKVSLSPAQVAEMFASVPQLEALDRAISFFREPEDVEIVEKRGGDGGKPPNTEYTTQPVLWSPVPGEELLVITGRAGKDAFLVAFHRLPGDRYRLASSLVLRDEKGPVALGINPYLRRKIVWSICAGCPAETGAITYREDHRVVIVQH